MSTNTPSRIDLITAMAKAQDIATNCHSAYWLSDRAGCENTGSYLRKQAREGIEELATLFGAKLVDITPETDEPEPLDAETVAARQSAYERSLIDAGRGHLIEGAA